MIIFHTRDNESNLGSGTNLWLANVDWEVLSHPGSPYSILSDVKSSLEGARLIYTIGRPHALAPADELVQEITRFVPS